MNYPVGTCERAVNRYRLGIAFLLLAIAAALVPLAPPSAANHIREGDVRFKVTCGYDHSANDDPIVFPDQPGASHLHDFTGKQGVDASTTTYADLVDGDDRTTCNDLDDLAAYWVPALYGDGVKIDPIRTTGYYRRGNKHGDIQPYPDGLKVVSDVGGWQCGGEEGRQVSSPRKCSTQLQLRIDFPDWWDGSNTDSADHRSHMAYSTPASDANVCPASHPVPVPRLTTYWNYPDTSARRFTLSSGAASGRASAIHGDFFNGWVRARLVERIETCLNQMQLCESGG